MMRRFISVCSIAVLLCMWSRCTRATDAGDWLDRGVALRHLGRYEEALLAYDKAAKIAPPAHRYLS
jgi:Flp pilus assembly protein TadD